MKITKLKKKKKKTEILALSFRQKVLQAYCSYTIKMIFSYFLQRLKSVSIIFHLLSQEPDTAYFTKTDIIS